MSKPLCIGFPSKGRLKDNAINVFKTMGYDILQPNGGRSYIGQIEGHPEIEVQFLAAGEIASELGYGRIHIGVTGEDLLAEKIPDVETRINILKELGFGHADVVIAVPQAWIDVTSLEDLEEVSGSFRHHHQRSLRVATKFVHLTRRIFAQHNIADYQIIGSLGATEGAPANGAADIIVDITSTGDTLRANGLKILNDGVILKSQAVLAQSAHATWDNVQQDTLDEMIPRLKAL